MFEKADDRLFEAIKSQDANMHNLSAEMSVKTSLYLVFSAFAFSASIQMVNFAKGIASPCARVAIAICSASAVISLAGGIFLLIAAMVRDYSVFPSAKMADWIIQLRDFRKEHPELATNVDPAEAILHTLAQTSERNKAQNEKKADWIELGARFLLASVPILAVGAGFALYAFFSRPS